MTHSMAVEALDGVGQAAAFRGRWKPYPAYKYSGAEWLGAIPVGWDVRRLKHVATCQMSNVDKKKSDEEEPVRLCNYTDVYYNERITGVLELMEASATPKEIKRFSLRSGDVLITKDSESWQDIAVAAWVPADLDGVLCGYHLAQLRPLPDQIRGDYLFWCLEATAVNSQFRVAATGITRYGLPTHAIENALLTVPPREQQNFIAAFLHRETARIDALMARKEWLVELLQEKRSALIARAVTKGLDPAVPMKETGVEWLGEIPAHWDVRRTKFAAGLRSGHTPSRQHAEYWENCTIPWFGLVDVWQLRDGQVEYVYDTAEKISELGLANSAARLLPKGTVILSRTASVGFSAIMGVDMATTQDFVNWVSGPTLRPEYLLYVFRSMAHEFKRLTMGSTHKTIYMPDVAAFSTPLPPVSEQDRIVTFVRKETGRIDALISKVREAIDRLEQLRAALISAAVTGKIDVREEAA